ncbi:MAG: GtrA family protein [Paracoccaceae bacterium]
MKLSEIFASSFFRFLVVGGTFSVIYSVTTAALIRVAAAPPFATSVVVYLLCIPWAFLAHKHFAFGARNTRKAAFPLYVLTQIVSLAAVAQVTTRFITHHFIIDVGILLLTSAIAAIASFLINRFVIFAAHG